LVCGYSLECERSDWSSLLLVNLVIEGAMAVFQVLVM
jgi:hypothetical protein